MIDADADEAAAREGSLDFDAGAWGVGAGGGNGFSTGNAMLDKVLGITPGIGLAQNMVGFLDFLAGQHWGDGVAGRGSSNDPTEGGNNGGNDTNSALQQIIETIVNSGGGGGGNNTTPRTITPNARAGAEGSRRPGSGSMRRPSMPYYEGIGSRSRRAPVVDDGIAYAGGSKWFDERTGQRRPGAPPLGPDQKQLMPITDSYESMTGAPRMSDAPPAGLGIAKLMTGLLGVNAAADQATNARQAPLNNALSRMYQRGDIRDDAASVGSVVNPIRGKAKDLALSQLLSGSRVSDNIFDLTNLGANIGQAQGAQNVNVRGRMPTRTRRF